jgi:voltage-gated potassium channel
VTWVDWALVGLAVVSLLLVVAEQALPSYLRGRPDMLRWFIVADLAICGVFALEFLIRMRGQRNKWAYTKSRWYDILGMVPVSHPLFRGFRLVRILRIVVITSRFVRATNRSFGEMVFEATVSRFRDVLVDVVGGAIVLRSVRMVEPYLVQARFAERIGDAMDERRDDIQRMVKNSIAKLPGSRMLNLRPMRGMMNNAEAAAVQAVIDTLRSDELNRLVQQSTQNIMTELQQQIIREESEKERGARRT